MTTRGYLKDSPLAGKVIGLTGTDAFRAKVRRALEGTGAECLSLMHARPEPTNAPIPWEKLHGSWIVFTSAQGVEVFFSRMALEGRDANRLCSCRFAVIGPATAKALAEHGYSADLCPEGSTSETLAAEMRKTLSVGERVVMLVSRKGSGVLQETLPPCGISVTRVDTYDVCYVPDPTDIVPDCIVFGSAGGVKALWESGFGIAPGTRCVCIGPICAGEFRRRFDREAEQASEITVEGIVETLLTL